jgi:tetratricopeptide (TPR) repeat protein
MRTVCVAAVAAVVAVHLVAVAHAQSADPVVERGFAALQRGDADAAAAVFRTALADRPRDAVLLYGAGYAAHLQGRDEDAARLLQEAMRIEPRLVQAALLAGEIAYRRGDLDLAITTYQRALTQLPSNLAIRERLEAWKAEAGIEERFEAYKDERFTVMFDGPAQQKLAAHATATMSAAFMRITTALGSAPSAPIRVVFYTAQQFHDVTGAPEWSGGGFDGQIRLALGGAAQDLAQFDRVLTHELTHAIVHGIAARNVPGWLHEGLAQRYESRAPRPAPAPMRRVFIPLAALQRGFGRLSTAQAIVAYDESGFAAGVLIERIGAQGLGELLRDLDGGETIDQAILRFGFTLPAFEADLARRFGAAPAPAAGR